MTSTTIQRPTKSSLGITRTWDAIKIEEALVSLGGSHLDPIEWLSQPENIVLENEHGDLAVFEYGLFRHKVYAGHYYFKSRGRQALQAGKAFLDELFNSCYNIHILMGLTPVEKRAAAWMSRQLGFTSYGFEEIHGNHYELFIITKKEFNGE